MWGVGVGGVDASCGAGAGRGDFVEGVCGVFAGFWDGVEVGGVWEDRKGGDKIRCNSFWGVVV